MFEETNCSEENNDSPYYFYDRSKVCPNEPVILSAQQLRKGLLLMIIKDYLHGDFKG